MQHKVYRINKGADSDMEFKGFSAQYIAYAGLGLLSCLVLFTLLYLLEVPSVLNFLICLPLSAGYYLWMVRLNKKYGKYGLMKKSAFKRVPTVLKIRDRGYLRKLKTNQKNGNGI